jgi:hypothetical protein
MASATNVLEILLMTLLLPPADAHQATEIKEDSVLLAVELMKSYPMVNAAALQDTTQLTEFADNAIGIKFTMKDSVSAEFHAMVSVSSIFPAKPVSVCLNIISWLMELARPALSTRPTVQLLSNASAIRDTSSTLASAQLLATLMSNMSTEYVCVKLDTTSLDTPVEFAHPPSSMIPPTESAELAAKLTKSGIL